MSICRYLLTRRMWGVPSGEPRRTTAQGVAVFCPGDTSLFWGEQSPVNMHDLLPPDVCRALLGSLAERASSNFKPLFSTSSVHHAFRCLHAGGGVFRRIRCPGGADDRDLSGDLCHLWKRAAKDLAVPAGTKRPLNTKR